MNAWTPEEDAALLAAYGDPSPNAIRRIAQSLGRSYQATRVHAGKIGARRRDMRGRRIKAGFHGEPTDTTDVDPIHEAYKAWRRVVFP